MLKDLESLSDIDGEETCMRLTFVLTALALATLPTLAAPQAGQGQSGAASTPEPRSGPALERFALYAPAVGHEQGNAELCGLVELRRQNIRGGWQLQREVRFVEGGRSVGRVVHVERLTERDARLSWREIGAAAGRSLCVEWTRDARGLFAFEWGRDGARRVTLEAWQGVVLPLYLIELARTGSATQGNYVTFDPLGRRLESLRLRTSYTLPRVANESAAVRGESWTREGHELGETTGRLPTEAGASVPSFERGARRTACLQRHDGTHAGSYTFAGTELVSFQLQSGGPIARRVTHATYTRILNGLSEAEAGGD